MFRRLILTSLLVIFGFCAGAQQAGTVHLSATELPVRQVIKEVEKQTGKFFGYSDLLDLSRKIRFDQTQLPLDSVLVKITGNDFRSEVTGGYILIYHRSLADPTGTIGGRIIDAATGRPLGGRITLSDTIRLWVDRSGYFRTAEIPEGEYLARITAEGYRPAWREWMTDSVPGYRNTVRLSAIDTLNVDTLPLLLDVKPARPDFAEYLRNHREPETVPAPFDLSAFLPFTPVHEARKGEPRWAVKTNALWWAAGFTLNGAVERRLKPGWSAEISLMARPWGETAEKSLRYWLVQPEIRRWFCDTYEKHFVGVHATYGGYKIGHRNLGGFTTLVEEDYLDGSAWGIGATYGYHLPMGTRWGAEFSIGVGYLGLQYDRYADKIEDGVTEKETRHYFGPTKIGVSFFYLIR